MVETRTDRTDRHTGVNPWRAGCGESRTSGSEGGPGKPTHRKMGRAPRSDPYYAAVTIAYREHTGDAGALSDFELANLPDPGRVVFESLADRWHQPDPEVLRLRAELGLDDAAGGSSSLGSTG